MKNEKMKYYALYIVQCILCITLSGCVEEYEADIPSDDSNLLVVEGTICSGKLNKFILSRTQALNGQAENVELVTGARVSVRGSDGSDYTTDIFNHSVRLELYSPNRADPAAEKRLETTFRQYGIHYRKLGRSWLESERFFLTTYYFDFTEKET